MNSLQLLPREQDRQLSLPIWTRCIFVDWHGVLSNGVFWESIVHSSNHALRFELGRAVDDLFGNRFDLVESWMRGLVSSVEVISEMEIQLSRKYADDFLLRRLIEDCLEMEINRQVMDGINSHDPDQTLRVLATDNMDCFVDASLRKKSDLRQMFDEILCSSEIGVLKAEDPQRFFGWWLEEHELSSTDAILVDDSMANCQQFERWGGNAIHYREPKSAMTELWTWMIETSPDRQ